MAGPVQEAACSDRGAGLPSRLAVEVAFPTEVVMLASLSRLALILGIGAGIVAFAGHHQPAFADDEDEEEEEDDGGDEGGEEECEDEEECGVDKDQPDITAGGLFTIKTYPKRELFRPLTMTQGITQVRAALGVDVSDKTAFEYAGVTIDGEYGLKDNFTLLAGFGGDYNFKAFDVNFGFEGALAYDLFDIRLQARIARAAVVKDLEPLTGKPDSYKAGAGTQFSVDLGFPFRYVARPEIAIVALETLIQFDFNSITRGAGMDVPCLQGIEGVDLTNCTEDGIKPDLAPSIGIASNPIEILSLVLFAQLQIRDFDTTNQFVVPATARIMFTPTQKFDIGLEFKFLDMKPKDPDGDGPFEAGKFYDNRFMNMFIQARY